MPRRKVTAHQREEPMGKADETEHLRRQLNTHPLLSSDAKPVWHDVPAGPAASFQVPHRLGRRPHGVIHSVPGAYIVLHHTAMDKQYVTFTNNTTGSGSVGFWFF